MSDINQRPLIRTKEDRGRAEVRRYHISPKKLTASPQTIATAGTQEVVQIQNLLISNGSGAIVTATVHVVPQGGAATDSTIVLDQLNIPANGQINISNAIGIPPGGTIQAIASVANTVRISGWATAYL